MARTSRLTDAKIKALQPTQEDYYESVDGLPLRLKVTPKGKKVFVAKWRIYRSGKPPKQMERVIGDWDFCRLDEACERARKIIAAGKAGIDQLEVWKREEIAEAKAFDAATYEADGDVIPDDMSFLKNAWDAYVNSKIGVTKRQEQKMVNVLKHIANNLDENIRTADLTVVDINKIKKTLEKKPEEFNRFRMTLYGVLEQEHFEGRIPRNIVIKVKPFPSEYRETVLSEKGIKDFKDFYSNLDNFEPHEHNHARFLLCLLYTGQRPSMLRSLKKEDDGVGNYLNPESGEMVFRKHKTAKKRATSYEVIYTSPKALEIMLEAMKATPYSPYVFGSHDERKSFRHLPLSEKKGHKLYFVSTRASLK